MLGKPPLVVWAGDMHINSMTALAPPKFRRDEGATHVFSRAQAQLWECWLDAWKEVYSRKRKTIVILGGDICDLDIKSRTNHLVTKNRTDALGAAAEVLDPALAHASAVIVLRGTEAHAGMEAEIDEQIARDITGVKVIGNDETGDKSWWYCRIKIGGKLFDLAHHTSMGASDLAEANAGNQLALKIRSEYAEWGEKPPDWVMRGHVHRYSESGTKFLPMRAVICPCWQLPPPYIHRAGKGGKVPQIGLVVIDLDGSNEPEWIRYEIKRSPAVGYV